MVEEQVKSRKVVRCQSCVSFTRMNKQVLLSRNRAASILKKTSPQLILLKEGTYNGQKFKLYRVEVEYDIDKGEVRAIKDCCHQVNLPYVDFKATSATICLFSWPEGGVFLACDYNGLEGVLSDKEQQALWAKFPEMGETKRAGGAAGHFDAVNLKTCLREI